jgi:uncharacterized glyoxalase superfamily protein PhnB
MKPTPSGWPRLSASLIYDDPRAAIAWLVEAFGFEVRIVVDGEGGAVMHSELTFGDAVVMCGSGGRDRGASPKRLGDHTGGLFLYVDDADAHHARAVAAGAAIVRELATVDYGPDHWSDRGYSCRDPERHLWHFAHRVRG